MPLTPVTMHALTCDACNTVFDDEEGGTLFATEADAAIAARASGWTVLGDEYLCHIRDEAHQALIDENMPPEPVMRPPGQLALDDCEPDWDLDDTTRIDYRDRDLLGQHATPAGIRTAATISPSQEYL